VKRLLSAARLRLAIFFGRMAAIADWRVHCVFVSVGPWLGREEYNACLMHGIEHAANLMKMEAEEHYADAMMAALRPDLLGEEP
jgi:hypothetical protein